MAKKIPNKREGKKESRALRGVEIGRELGP